MLDKILGWLVIVAPFVLSVIFVLIPTKTENPTVHKRWMVGVFLFGLGFSGMAWWQQSRTVDASVAASQQVASNTAAKVTDTLNRQYSPFIKGLYEQIGSLGAELQQQKSLREKDLSMNYEPAIDLIYAGNQLQLWNRGRMSVALWGNKYDGSLADLGGKPDVIGPTDDYYLLTDKLHQLISASLGANGEAREPVEFYFTSADHRKFVLPCTLWEVMKLSVLTIHTQCNPPEFRDWSKR